MNNDFEATWNEGETPAKTGVAEELAAQREAQGQAAGDEFAQAFEQEQQA